MKFKYFLRGLGVGIVFASIIFLTAYMSGSSWKMSDKEIMDRAKELGMVQQEENVRDLITTTENITDTQISSDTESESKTSTSSEENKTNTETETEASTETVTTEHETAKTDNTSITITVDRGSSSFPVCQKLQEAGLIEDASEFDTYLVENGYANRIRVGEHVLKKGMSFHDIAEAISDPL